MTSRQFVALGVRLFAIWLAIYVLETLPGIWLLAAQRPMTVRFTAMLTIGTLILVLAVIALWFLPLVVARKLLPKSALDQLTSLPPHDQIERAGFCLIGLWLLTHAIPSLAFEAVVAHLYSQPGSTLELAPQNYADLTKSLVELGLSIWLLLGAKGLRGVLYWARTIGSGAATADRSSTPDK